MIPLICAIDRCFQKLGPFSDMFRYMSCCLTSSVSLLICVVHNADNRLIPFFRSLSVVHLGLSCNPFTDRLISMNVECANLRATISGDHPSILTIVRLVACLAALTLCLLIFVRYLNVSALDCCSISLIISAQSSYSSTLNFCSMML